MPENRPRRETPWFGPPGNLILMGASAFFVALAVLTAYGSGEPGIVGVAAYLGGVLQVLAIARASR